MHRRELLKEMPDGAVAAMPRLDHLAINSNERTREWFSSRIVKLAPRNPWDRIRFEVDWLGIVT